MFIVVLGMVITGPLAADMTEDVTDVFNDFLGRLTAKHEALESLAMPALEVRAPPGAEEAITTSAVILRFESVADREVFSAALEVESISYVSFPDKERELLLFTVDMMIFVMQDVIGL
jgi:hypothetical protein